MKRVHETIGPRSGDLPAPTLALRPAPTSAWLTHCGGCGGYSLMFGGPDSRIAQTRTCGGGMVKNVKWKEGNHPNEEKKLKVAAEYIKRISRGSIGDTARLFVHNRITPYRLCTWEISVRLEQTDTSTIGKVTMVRRRGHEWTTADHAPKNVADIIMALGGDFWSPGIFKVLDHSGAAGAAVEFRNPKATLYKQMGSHKDYYIHLSFQSPFDESEIRHLNRLSATRLRAGPERTLFLLDCLVGGG
jgi:hypothetical protein